MSLTRALKRLVYQAMPESQKLRYLTYLPSLRQWRETRAASCPSVRDRQALYEYVNSEVLGNLAIDYLEFGVYKGDSFKRWVRLNTQAGSRFHGFDTFTGLPEDWGKFSETMKAGAFDVGGSLPQVADSRAAFHKGLFQETLPRFLDDYRPGNTLVIHNDCDLYSATLFVLTQLDRFAAQGTVVIFDEFPSVLHEFRAFEDYCSAYMRRYEVLASAGNGEQVAIRFV